MRNKQYFYFFTLQTICFCFVLPLLQAQKPADFKRNAEKAFSEEQWRLAQQDFLQYQQLKPGDNAVLTKLGIAYYHLKDGENAKKYLEYVATQAPNPDACYYYARTLHGLQEWEKAILAYKNFLRTASERHPWRANAADNIRRCLSGQRITHNPNVALVENLGDRINSDGDEFAPLPSINHADRLYYSAARAGSIGDKRNSQGIEDAKNGHYCGDMLKATRKTGGWEKNGSLGTLLNTSRHEVALGFNASGAVLYFFRGFTLYSGQIFADTADRKDEYAISPPPFISPMQPEEGDVSTFFFSDSVLLFASRRPGGFGGLDLWITQKKDSTWSAPLNLGPEINSAYDETTPFLAMDGRNLWFSSNRTSSMGGMDVFKAVFDEKKLKWSEPLNAGMPINTPGDDLYFKLSPDGQQAFWASDRLNDNLGQRDIYTAYFKEILQEQRTNSIPPLFTDLLHQQAQANAQEYKRLKLPSLVYAQDQDLVSGENRGILAEAAAAAGKMPASRILITVHAPESSLPKFDLYNGIKRAELVGKTLVSNGVDPERILLRSAGAAFPYANLVVDGSLNPFAEKFNRRADIHFTTINDPLAIDVQTVLPAMAESMRAPGMDRLLQSDKGLTFKVLIANTRQMLNSDALGMFTDILIESKPGSNVYQYSSGLFDRYDKAAQLKAELVRQGFQEAQVMPYINAIPINKAEAISLMRKYPELAAYVRG